jgi:hypothetical protein
MGSRIREVEGLPGSRKDGIDRRARKDEPAREAALRIAHVLAAMPSRSA